MDINALIQILQCAASQIAESCCIVNGALMDLDEVENMGYNEFSMRARMNTPLKLYKYFPNRLTKENTGSSKTVNYSIQALRDNTVFMQSPGLFDDVYDSDISLNPGEYEKFRLLEYCERCELHVSEAMTTEELGNALLQAIREAFNAAGNFDSVFKRKPASEIEELSSELFLKNLQIELRKDGDLGKAVARVIGSDYKEYTQHLQNTFRVTCFATSPYSQLMWGGSYADCHRGFCVEYTVLPDEPQYQELFYNLFPMIYCKVRPNITERLARYEYKETTIDSLWDIYFHGALRKSIDWAFQNEWRLLLPLGQKRETKDYCVPFFPITKVFLGNRMPPDARKEIIEICHEKNIPYIGMTRNPNIFEMQECSIQCEDCPGCTGNIPEWLNQCT